MRNIAIVLAVAVLATYAFIAVNERQKERIIRLRLPKFRKINKYEFDKALYQIRETRAKRIKKAVQPFNQANTYNDPREDFYRDYEYLENLKNAPATEAMPIQEPPSELQPQEENMQGQETPQEMQQRMMQGQEETTEPEQQQEQRRPIPRPIRRYQQLAPQADINDGNM